MRWYEGKILIFGNEKRTAVVEMSVDKLKSCHGIFDRVIIESVHARVSLFPRVDVCMWENREDAGFTRERKGK